MNNARNLFELGMQELANNRIRFAKAYFKKAARQGNQCANKCFLFLCNEKDKALARDLLLCAERRV